MTEVAVAAAETSTAVVMVTGVAVNTTMVVVVTGVAVVPGSDNTLEQTSQ